MSGTPAAEVRPATSGAARRARERKLRSTGRHIAWVFSVQQATAAHHTSAESGGGGAVCATLAALRREIGELQAEKTLAASDRLQKKAELNDLQLQVATLAFLVTDLQAAASAHIYKDEFDHPNRDQRP